MLLILLKTIPRVLEADFVAAISSRLVDEMHSFSYEVYDHNNMIPKFDHLLHISSALV